MWNPLQPKRDLTGIDARTHIRNFGDTFNPQDAKNRAAQLMLYRWCLGEEYVDSVAIGELHDFLFWQYPQISKRQMGQVVVQATTYNPRKLKGVTSDNQKACMTYVWPNRLDLQYGLEWQLSMWIWGLDKSWEELSQLPDPSEFVQEIFDEVGSCEEQDFGNLYMMPTLEGQLCPGNEQYLQRPDWPTLWARHGWENEDWQKTPTERSTSLRRVSTRGPSA